LWLSLFVIGSKLSKLVKQDRFSAVLQTSAYQPTVERVQPKFDYPTSRSGDWNTTGTQTVQPHHTTKVTQQYHQTGKLPDQETPHTPNNQIIKPTHNAKRRCITPKFHTRHFTLYQDNRNLLYTSPPQCITT